MGLDALRALSLAGTLVQCFDFGSKLLAKGQEIHDSVDRTSVGNSDIETATRDLRDLNVRLNASALSRDDDVGVNTSIVAEVALAQLTTKCSAVVDELLEAFGCLKIQGGSNRRWAGLREALESAHKQDKLDELNSRLQALRRELSFNVLSSFREEFDLLAIKSSAGFAALEPTTKELTEKLLQQQQRAFADQTSSTAYGQENTNEIVNAQHDQTRREIIETSQPKRSNLHTTTPSFSLWSIDEPEGSDVTEESEGLIPLPLGSAKPTCRPRSQSYEPKPTPTSPSIQNQNHTTSISPIIQYREQVSAFRPTNQTPYVEVQEPVHNMSPNGDQNWSSEPSQWGPLHHQPRQAKLPPPLPPKIPKIPKIPNAQGIYFELEGSPVAPPNLQAHGGSQPISRPFPPPSRPLATGPTPWGAHWRVGQSNPRDSRGHLTPVDIISLRLRPHSAQGISHLSQQYNQPGLSHHRSYNSFSAAQNTISQTTQRTQYADTPYPITPPSGPPPYQPLPIEDRNHSTPIRHSQPVPAPPLLHVNTTYIAPDPCRESPGQNDPISEHLTLQSPARYGPNSYPIHPSLESRPRAVSNPHQHHHEFLPDPYQRPSPSQSAYPPRNVSPSQSPYNVYSSLYAPDSAQHTAPSNQSYQSPSQSSSPMISEPEISPESVPVNDGRPISWIRRLTKSSRT